MSDLIQTTPVAGYSITILGSKSEHTLTVNGRLPGLNEYTDACRTNPRAGAKMKQEAQDMVMWHILSQLRRVRFTKPVFLLFTFYEQDRRRDRDNVSSFARKVIQDALVKCGNLQDDGWDYVTGYLDRFQVDRENPRIVVEFIEQEAEPCRNRQSKKSGK
jgi:hypothetical protein